MTELRPYPMGSLVDRMFRELQAKQAIFDLSARRFFAGDRSRDLSVLFHGRRASSPLGPAAGPHTQMAQNIVLSWLGGCRIMELKTVQILDELAIPRPCIDMQTIGYNVEWSQELRLEQSLEEYVKAAMLIQILRESGAIAMESEFGDVLYDMSVGYDLKGIQSDSVMAFLRGMLDCREVVERLRSQIPSRYRKYRDLDFPTRLSDTLTLSTFHGCPPDEIEGMIDFLLGMGVHCVIKLNPMLLGKDEVRVILNEELGYREVSVPDSAFARDTTWAQMAGFVTRLKETADRLRLGLGVKFTNTLIVENRRDFFKASEREMYLSGAPLHVIAMQLVSRFREQFGGEIPISFSAGIDRKNFPDAVACGLVPVTVCSDLLKPGGYGRAGSYLKGLCRRMSDLDVCRVEDLVVKEAFRSVQSETNGGTRHTPPPHSHCLEAAVKQGADLRRAAGTETYARWLSWARCQNSRRYAERARQEARYSLEKNERLPPKIGRHLVLFDCITCDKCVPVCPNHANFTFTVPAAEITKVKVSQTEAGWNVEEFGTLTIAERHQIGNFVDFCNDCGNCDVFCPEDGGPYVIKPRFFARRDDWREPQAGDGFCLERLGKKHRAAGRFAGVEYYVTLSGGHVEFTGTGFDLEFKARDPLGTLKGHASGTVDLTYYHILKILLGSVLADSEINYLTCLPTPGE